MASYVDMAKEVLASIAERAKAGTPGKPGEIEAVVVPKAKAEPNLAETAGLSELAELPPIEQSLKGRAVELWRTEVLALIESVAEAFRSVKAIRDEPIMNDYLLSLFLKERR